MFCRLWASFELIQKVEAQNVVLKVLRAGAGFKRCAIVDIVPTGSYQATLKRIGLDGVGFEGFPFGPLYFRSFVNDLAWCRAILNSCVMQDKAHIVLEEVRAGSSFKRCAVVDIVPTGSYQATLTQISLYRIGFKGFPFGTFGFEQVVLCPCVASLPYPFALLRKCYTRW